MTKFKSIEINCKTGEVIETPYTEEELAELSVLEAQIEAEAQARRDAKEAEDAARILAKASAEAKLSALGLTSEEIAALII